jgi:tetratricopeptide (TPR) repeat protein
MTVPFTDDDDAKAIADANAKGVPVFVEAWAPWCHTCRSMRAFVFTDASLEKRAGEFVWLAIDTENPKNAEAVKLLKPVALPTFYVLDPKDQSVARRWVGGMTLAQLGDFMNEGGGAVAAKHSGAAALLATATEDPLARGDRLYGAGDFAGAAEAYAAAWPNLAPTDSRYARVAEAMMFSYSETEQPEKGLAFAEAALPKLGRTTSGVSAAGSALSFTLALPADAPGRAEKVATYEKQLKDLMADPSIALADDDRSGYLIVLLEARQDAKDEKGTKEAAAAWAAFLEDATKRATTPEKKAVFDSHRVSAYIEMGQPEKAIPYLDASEKELPNDYNPPARLAAAYAAMKQWDKALAASDRALAKAYGPRKLRLYSTRADVYVGKGDAAAAKAALDEALKFGEGLPESQRPNTLMASLKKKRDGIGGT